MNEKRKKKTLRLDALLPVHESYQFKLWKNCEKRGDTKTH